MFLNILRRNENALFKCANHHKADTQHVIQEIESVEIGRIGRKDFVTIRVSCVGTLGFRRNCMEACCAVVSWDVADHRIELQEMSPNASPGNNTCVSVVVFVFDLGQSRTEHHLVHLLDL